MTCERSSPLLNQITRLERIFQRKLHDTWIFGRRDAPEKTVVEVRLWVDPAEPVERVERLDACLDAVRGGKPERPDQRRSTLLVPGPVNELRSWLPSVPTAGIAKAAGLR